ncbi:phosphoribosylaminoimidazole carboxylase ade2 [Boothiomyces sp. JEL0838]|nr:phosphoribosylaminoimidazole carboxylase ade2 [Boothiomyces sp. JEL0838]
MDSKKIGILGGGQLGRMMNEAAARLNIQTIILDQENAPAKQISNQKHINGSFADPESIKLLAKESDVLTVEIEHVDTKTLQSVVESGVPVHPDPTTIRTIQDKYQQKQFLLAKDPSIPISPFRELTGDLEQDLKKAGQEYGYPLMLKSKTLAYDGRGNKVVKSEAEVAEAIKALGGGPANNGPGLYVEKFVKFVKELAVMVAKSSDGTIASYPCVETVQKDNICHLVIAPAQIDGLVREKAQVIAESIAKAFSGVGIYGVELFMLEDGDLTFNEIAPRPHNSGHYTIEACHTSQFEQHLRCVAGLPLASTAMKVPASIMINIIGKGDGDEGLKETLEPCKNSLSIPGATVHLYGKSGCKKGRKMGHITLVGESMSELLNHTKHLMNTPVPKPAPLVGIIMGSDSDLPTVKPAAQILKGFDTPFELTIVSAHRTPDRMVEYAKNAHLRGLKVIIAAAGGAAHLPGMVAALTPLPVIGIPVALKLLDGVDSLHSIVQMPRGVPVATVAINNAVNAGLLAVRILSTLIPSYTDKLLEYSQLQEDEVMKKVEKLERSGWEKYELA